MNPYIMQASNVVTLLKKYSQQNYLYNELNQKIMVMQLQAIIGALGSFSHSDPEILQKIKSAQENWTAGNIQQCAQVLNVFKIKKEIIYREDQSKQEKEFYATMLTEVQTLASGMLAQYLEQMQQMQPQAAQMMMNMYQQGEV